MATQKIAILGGGESGVGAARLALAKGYDVFLSDAGKLKDAYRAELQALNVPFEEGGHTPERIFGVTEVIKSPGIPGTAPLVQQLRAQGTPVISEIEFAARYTNAKLIGITGSNGKTTTTLLTYHLLRSAGLNVGLGGNIGDSFAKQVIDDTFDCFVLEISSFQLDDMFETRLDTAVLLNITPDHLDRYDYVFQNYVDSKFRIIRHQRPEDAFIYFRENPAIRAELMKSRPDVQHLPISLETNVAPGGYVADGRLHATYQDRTFDIDVADLPLQGPHNQLNMLAATLAALTVGVSDEAIAEGLRTFRNAEHRMEPAGEVNGVKFINDSKATNVDSVYYALKSMTAPTVWIAGGQDKGNDYGQLDDVARQHVKALVCLGKDNRKLKSHFATLLPTVVETQDVTEAVRLALSLAAPGDVVLLSPACASFDLFKNYEDRGNQFKTVVQTLTNAT